MFSATFPHSMEQLARAALCNPVEIQVGGRSVVNPDIEQCIEIRPEEERFLRLLELLGEWYEQGKIIVFVHTQENCDTLFRDLLRSGYPCLSLHGGKEQTDRECTIADFKSDVCNILVATSVAARGLDVKELRLVVNYDVPNHHEDYVHRVGRTGRAGQKARSPTPALSTFCASCPALSARPSASFAYCSHSVAAAHPPACGFISPLLRGLR